MSSCGHQVDADWLLCSSAGVPVTGLSTASTILESVFAEGPEDGKNAIKPHDLDAIQGRSMRLSLRRLQYGRSCTKSSAPSCHNFSDFDEEEHLDGCPVKWLYKRQAAQPTYTITVRELKVRKMNLKNRQNRKKRKKSQEINISTSVDCAAAHEDTLPVAEETYSCLDHGTCFSNYMPPRPLTGMRPWFCILLAPRSAINHYSTQRPPDTRTSISVRSLSLPQVARPLATPATPRASRAFRWAGPIIQQRTLQAPPALDIALRGGKIPVEEDRMYQLKRFLESEAVAIRKPEASNKPCSVPRKTTKNRKKNGGGEREEIHVICSRVQFFERPGKPMR